MKYNIERVNCNICGSDDYMVVWDKEKRKRDGTLGSVVIEDDDGNIINGRNVCCHVCGLVYINPRMDKTTQEKFYETEYRKFYTVIHKHLIQAEKINAENAIRCFMKYWVKPLSLLDIGCSNGTFIDSLNLFHEKDNIKSKIIGIDPNKNVTNKNVIKEDFMEYEFDEKFDAITIFDTLEHMNDPSKTLEKIYSLLNVGGTCFIIVPNLVSTNIVRNSDVILSNAHLYTFSDNTLERLLNNNKFEITESFSFCGTACNKIAVVATKVKDTIKNENIVQSSGTVKGYLDARNELIRKFMELNGKIIKI